MKQARRILFWTHLAAGCAAGIVLLIMAVTGVLLAYQRQITSWMDRDARAAESAGAAGRLPIETLLAALGNVTPAATAGPKGRLIKAVCRCSPPRIIRVARSTLEAAPIQCAACGREFVHPASLSQGESHEPKH